MFMNHEIPNRLPSIHYIHEKKQFLANDIFGIMILDQYSYLRWLSVYIQDYLSLPITSRKIYQKIEVGILCSTYQVDSFHESIMINLTTT